MRPVNLIPPEERRGENAATRTGALSYVVVAILAVVLAGVCGVVYFDQKISDREADLARLETDATAAQARAASLAPFVSFQQVHDARIVTIDQLAKSRFDWERVLRELSRVIPRHIWLTTLDGSVTPEAAAGDGGGSALRAEIPGPALGLSGCGRSHRDVARLIAAMKDIDGVTRVTATDSQKPDADVAPTAAPVADAPVVTEDCQTRSTISKFNLIAAFDGVPLAAEASTQVPGAPPVAPPTPEATPTSAGG